jgi:outer membrane receptor protein involved in Fe transport
MRKWLMAGGVIVGFLVLSAGAVAQDLDETGMDEFLAEAAEATVEGEAVSTAAGYAQAVEETPSNVYVITRKMIEAHDPKHPADMLRFVPGVTAFRTFHLRYATGAMGAGGSAGNRFLILVDGHRSNSPSDGAGDFHLLPLSTDEVERIEVVLGPESVLYGSNAFGGVVNFITRKRLPEGKGVARVRVGSWNYAQQSVFATDGKSRVMVEHDLRAARPAPVDSGGSPSQLALSRGVRSDDIDRLQMRASHAAELGNGWEMDLSVGVSDARVDHYSNATVPTPGGSEQEGLFTTLDLRRSMGEGSLSLSQTFYRTDRVYDGPAFPTGGTVLRDSRDRMSQTELRYTQQLGRWRLMSGAGIRSAGITGAFTAGDEAYQNEFLYALGELRVSDKLTLYAGARRHFQEIGDDETSWKVAGIYRPRADLGIRLNYGTSFREPDIFTSRLRSPAFFPTAFGTVPINVPAVLLNRNLDSERAQGFLQLGIEKKWDRSRGKLDLYSVD